MTNPISDFVDALERLDRPETLWPLASTARSLAVGAANVGALVHAHAMLLLLARRVDDALLEDEWVKVRAVAASLAAFVRDPKDEAFQAIGRAWLDLAHPESLH